MEWEEPIATGYTKIISLAHSLMGLLSFILSTVLTMVDNRSLDAFHPGPGDPMFQMVRGIVP